MHTAYSIVYMYSFKIVSDKTLIAMINCGRIIKHKSVVIRCLSSSIPQSNSEKEMLIYSTKKQTPVSLKSLMDTGKGDRLDELGSSSKLSQATASQKVLTQVACFLHRELPVRLAHRAVRLESSPIFARNEHFAHVASWYKTSFAQLRACPAPSDPEKEAYFAKVIEAIYERHGSTLITMAKGAHELRSHLKEDIISFAEHDDIQKRLDEFYMSRIGIRMLIGQYLALRKPSDTNMIGLISQNASPFVIAKQAISDATYMCERAHGDAPEVTIHGRTDLTFPYVSSHIHYMLLELLKNSMRATVELHREGGKLPPIRIVIADGESNEDVVMKISDEGGGIRRSNINRIWSYLFTTADPSVVETMLGKGSTAEELKDFDVSSPLAGLGYGLPISRNYARYFGGDLNLMSMEGYGTDSFIYLPRLGDRDSAIIS